MIQIRRDGRGATLAAIAHRGGAGRCWARRPRAPGDRSIHQAVTSEAIETLPKGLQAVLQGAPAGDADRWPSTPSRPEDESPDRRFALDRLLPVPVRGPARAPRPR